MIMKSKYWIAGWLVIVGLELATLGIWVYRIDPYMHFHKPDTARYFYSLDNQRSQNDGITKHFDYDALITGTSMTETNNQEGFKEGISSYDDYSRWQYSYYLE